MDYWPRLKLTVHDDEEAFFQTAGDAAPWLFTSKSTRSYLDADFHPNDWLIFGSETHGLSDQLLQRHSERSVRIPQVEGERCLNLSTAVGIGLYEALRRVRR
jgi:tRNA (cytidine/uridine-2'-O-)-methyltransferase